MSYVHSGSVLFQKQRVLCTEHAQTKSAPKPLQNTLHGKGALEKAPLWVHKETGMWRHYLRPKKVAFRTFRVRKSASNVLLYMKDLQMCAYYPDCRHVPYFIIHCQRLKLNVDFRGESVRWSQTPSPLAYAVYAFINVDNCERPLTIIIFQLGTPEYHKLCTKTTQLTHIQLYLFCMWAFLIDAN